MMSWDAIISTAALGGHLIVGAIAALHWGQTRGAGSLAVLSAAISTWTIASFAANFVDPPHAKYLELIEMVVSPFIPMLALLVTLRFTAGRPRAAEWGLAFGAAALASISVLGWFNQLAYTFVLSHYWDAAYLLLANATVGAALVHLQGYLYQRINPQEKERTVLLICALILGWSLGITEVLYEFDLPVPRLGRLGLAMSSGMLAFAVLRYRLLPSDYPASFVAFMLVSIILIFSFSATILMTQSWIYTAVLPTTLLGSAALIPLWRVRGRQQQQARNVAANAHVSARLSQMQSSIYQLRNDLDSDQRFNQLDLHVAPTNLASLVANILKSFVVPITIETHLRSATAIADANLVRKAIESLIEYMVELMPHSSTLRIETGTSDSIFIFVEEEIPSIPSHLRSLAFEEFLSSTISNRSDATASFVRQVVESHRGHITVSESTDGAGLRIALHFPRPFEPRSR